MTGKKQVFQTDRAPAARGPYSQAVGSGDLLFISGQVPLVPETGRLVQGGIEEQAEQAFKNLGAVAEAAGANLQMALKITIYLTDMANFSKVNEIMRKHVPEPHPARATIGVASLPASAEVEVDAILHR